MANENEVLEPEVEKTEGKSELELMAIEAASKIQPQEPVAPEPAEEPAKPAEPAPIQNDYDYLEGVVDYKDKSPDEIRQTISARLKAANELEEKVKSFEGKAPEYKSTLAKRYDSFVAKTGSDDFDTFNKIEKFDVSKAEYTADERIAAMVQKEVLENPELKGKEDLIERKIRKDYVVEVDEDAEQDDKDLAELANLKLLKDSKAAIDFIKDYKTKYEPVDVAPQQQASREEMDKFIQLHNEHLSKELENFVIKVPDVKLNNGVPEYDNSKTIDITFDEGMKADISSYEIAYLGSLSKPPTAEQLVEARQLSRAMVIDSHLPTILKNIRENVYAQVKEEFAKQKANPSVTEAKQPEKPVVDFDQKERDRWNNFGK